MGKGEGVVEMVLLRSIWRRQGCFAATFSSFHQQCQAPSSRDHVSRLTRRIENIKITRAYKLDLDCYSTNPPQDSYSYSKSSELAPTTTAKETIPTPTRFVKEEMAAIRAWRHETPPDNKSFTPELPSARSLFVFNQTIDSILMKV